MSHTPHGCNGDSRRFLCVCIQGSLLCGIIGASISQYFSPKDHIQYIPIIKMKNNFIVKPLNDGLASVHGAEFLHLFICLSFMTT